MRSSSHNDPVTGFNWRSLPLVLPYLLEYRWRIAFAMTGLVLAKAAAIAGPFVLKHAVDDLAAATASALLPVAVLGLVAAYGLARFATVLFGEIRDVLFGRVTERAMRRIGLRVFQHLHALDLEFHLDRRTGGLARDIERGTNGISFLMRFLVFNIAPTLIEIIVVAILLAWHYGAAFAAITLASVVLYAAYSVVTTDWRTAFIRAEYQADSASNTRAVDSLLNYETVKYFGNESYESDRYDTELARWEQARRNNRLSLFALNAGQALIISLAMTASMSLAAWHVAQGRMSIGDFVLINAFMMQLFMPLNFLGMVYREIKGSLAAIEQLFALMNAAPRVADAADAGELVVPRGRIEFRHVDFHYRSDREILHNVDFSIEPGQKVAVVGSSGSGKSTLVKLLFRFHDVTRGAILIDGQDVRHVTQASLRAAIGIVPQDTVLFNDTLYENIRYGRPSASEAEIGDAVRLAHLETFVAGLPQGLSTRVGERGLKLSGGERQRVAIARTILKRPPILVFDEATSSLDSKAETAINDALKAIARGHTSLVIAHRLSTIVDADRIVVLEAGRIVEQGRHAELVAADGAYAMLWNSQQRAAERTVDA
jgi:ATP-binding cassette, subfamily B, heavy metal transporter